MCLSLCHIRRMVYFNHEENLCGGCARNLLRSAGSCVTCQHRQGAVCLLTAMRTPVRGWCCHYDVSPIAGVLSLTPDVVGPVLRWDFGGDIAEMLETFGVAFTTHATGADTEYRVAVEDLAVPWVYGVACDDWEATLGFGEGDNDEL